MNSPPTQFLFIILALLQLVAPLVHAHTGEELSAQGIHIPGYEHYSASSDSAEFQVITHPGAEDYSIISVSAGISHKNISSDNTSPSCLHIESFSFKLATRNPESPSHQQRQTPLSAVHYLILPSRAPPSENFPFYI